MDQVKRMWENCLSLQKRLTGWKKFLFYLFCYTLLFSVAFLLAYSPFWRTGKSYIWISDGRNQHYPTLAYIGRYLRQVVLHLLHGEIEVPLFDLNLAMGGDVIATLNFYGFGNPLYLLSIFVPTRYTEHFYNFLVVARLYLAGLSFWALCAHHKKETPYALIGALVYVFSGYAVISAVRHPFFIEPMIQLPLLLIGIDRVMKREKPLVFILSVFYSALCGYYFLYMMTIMLGFYVLIHFFDCYKESRWKNFFAMAGRIMGAYLLGIGLSAPIFLPSVAGFLISARTGGSAWENYFSYGRRFYIDNLLNIIAPPGSWIAISLAALVLLALAALFLFPGKGRRSLKLLLLVSVIFYVFPLGGYIMNGFGYPTQRWTFGIALLLSYILVEMFPELLGMNRKRQIGCFVVATLYTAVVFCSGQNRTAYHVAGAAMLGLTLAVLYLFGDQSGRGKRIGALACAGLVLFNVGINAIYRFSARHENYVNEFTAHGAETERLETLIEREAGPYLEPLNGRFDGSSFSLNGGVVWHIPTSYTFWSVFGAPIAEFGRKVENARMLTLLNISGLDKRTGLEALFSTKYLLEKKGAAQQIPYGYSVINETEKGTLVYENQYALPWGYTYDSYISSDEAEMMNGLETEEAMLQNIILEEAVENIEKGSVESSISTIPYEVTEMKSVKWENGVLDVEKNNATITLGFHIPADREGYIRLKGFDINDSGQTYFYVTVKCGNSSHNAFATSTSHNWYQGRENYLVNLEYSGEERKACTITFPKKGVYKLAGIELFALPMDKYPEQIEALREEPLENIEFGTNRIAGTVDLSKNKILCMSIPYSKGWTAKVDGQKVKILKGNYMFMAVPLAAGRHDVEFTYCSPGLKAGVAFCCIGLIGTAVLLVRQKPHRKDGEQNRED